jgi:CRISPR-associated protein Cas2
MFVILSYDVGEARVARVGKIAKKYLSPLQRSLYKGFLTEKQIERMKNELSQSIDAAYDKIVVYKIENASAVREDTLGDYGEIDNYII